MSGPLHLVQMRLDPAVLLRFAASQGLDFHRDEDSGYALHAWLAATFGDAAPKPFRWFEGKGELLGYTGSDHRALAEHAQAFAAPTAYAVLRPDGLQSKTMPALWEVGRRVSMTVLACPVSRNGKTEKDIYLRELDNQGDAARSREAVYLDWFRRQWGEAIALERVELTGFDRGRSLRRGQSVNGRISRTLERPRAYFSAVAEVRDGNRFNQQLSRGIGRHRAFGFGMVLLTPPP